MWSTHRKQGHGECMQWLVEAPANEACAMLAPAGHPTCASECKQGRETRTACTRGARGLRTHAWRCTRAHEQLHGNVERGRCPSSPWRRQQGCPVRGCCRPVGPACVRRERTSVGVRGQQQIKGAGLACKKVHERSQTSAPAPAPCQRAPALRRCGCRLPTTVSSGLAWPHLLPSFDPRSVHARCPTHACMHANRRAG